MKRTVVQNTLLACAAILSVSLAVPVVAGAQSSRAQEAQAAAAERQDAAKTRLADAKLKACQNREKVITNIMSRLGDRGQKQLDLFTKIAERTEAFYTEKGRTIANYDALVTDVNDKKVVAQTTVDATKGTMTAFKCDGTDPKGAGASFQDALKTQANALKDYKTAVRNLIVGVKSAQGTASSDANKSTDSTKTTEVNQ